MPWSPQLFNMHDSVLSTAICGKAVSLWAPYTANRNRLESPGKLCGPKTWCLLLLDLHHSYAAALGYRAILLLPLLPCKSLKWVMDGALSSYSMEDRAAIMAILSENWKLEKKDATSKLCLILLQQDFQSEQKSEWPSQAEEDPVYLSLWTPWGFCSAGVN